MVIWITGKKGAGKTAVAYKLARAYPQSLVLDGDEMRQLFPEDFTDIGRANNIGRLAKWAAHLENEGYTAIVACISPRKEWRQAARALFTRSILIYLPGGKLWKGTTYEIPDEEELA